MGLWIWAAGRITRLCHYRSCNLRDLLLRIRCPCTESIVFISVTQLIKLHREWRLRMSVFTFLLDTSVLNAYALYKSLIENERWLMSLWVYKHAFWDARVTSFLVIRRENLVLPPLQDGLETEAEFSADHEVVAAVANTVSSAPHMLLALPPLPPGIGRKLCHLFRLHRILSDAQRCTTVFPTVFSVFIWTAMLLSTTSPSFNPLGRDCILTRWTRHSVTIDPDRDDKC